MVVPRFIEGNFLIDVERYERPSEIYDAILSHRLEEKAFSAI